MPQHNLKRRTFDKGRAGILIHSLAHLYLSEYYIDSRLLHGPANHPFWFIALWQSGDQVLWSQLDSISWQDSLCFIYLPNFNSSHYIFQSTFLRILAEISISFQCLKKLACLLFEAQSQKVPRFTKLSPHPDQIPEAYCKSRKVDIKRERLIWEYQTIPWNCTLEEYMCSGNCSINKAVRARPLRVPVLYPIIVCYDIDRMRKPSWNSDPMEQGSPTFRTYIHNFKSCGSIIWSA